MYIVKIELENIKKYSSKTIEFSKGLNFISGKNGSGKTTIIESIGYAIFNYQSTSRNFANHFIKKGEKKGRVRVYFLNKFGKKYVADRRIGQTMAGRAWSVRKNVDGEEIVVAEGNDDVINFMKENLEFYPDDDVTDIYKNIIGVPQGEFTQSFFYTETERKAVFDPIFKLDSYKKSFDNIKLNKGIEEKIASLNESIASYKGELKDSENVIKKLNDYEEELKKLEQEEKEESLLCEKSKKRFKEFDDIRIKIDNIKVKINEIKLKTEKYCEMKKIKVEELEKIKLAKEILKKNAKEYDKYNNCIIEIEKLDDELKKLESKKKDNEKIKQRIENGKLKVEERKKLLDTHLKRQKELEKKMNDSLEKIKKINEVNASSNKEDEITKQLDLLKDTSNKFIEKTTSLVNLKKQITLALKKQLVPEKGVMYLNRAKDLLSQAKKIATDEVVTYIDEAEDNINMSLKSKDSDSNLGSDLKDLINIKEKLEEEILGVYNKFVEEKIDKIIDVNIVKETFNQNISEKEKKINEKFIENQKIIIEKKHLNEQYQALQVELVDLKKTYEIENAEKERWINKILELEEEVEVLKVYVEKYDNLVVLQNSKKEEQKKYKLSYEAYVQNMKIVQNETDVSDVVVKCNENIGRLESQKQDLFSGLDSLTKVYSTEEYDNEKNKYEKIKSNVSVINEKIKNNKLVIDECRSKQKYFETLREKIEKEQKEVMNLKKAIELINKIRDIIKNAPYKIADMLIGNISLRAADIYSEIASDSNKLVWENTYELVLYDYTNGNEIRKEFRELSGGEQMSAALSIRFAMLEILTKLKLGILDEPTTNMDSLRREHLAEIISNSSERFNQLIVVSHDDTFENITQNVIVLQEE